MEDDNVNISDIKYDVVPAFSWTPIIVYLVVAIILIISNIVYAYTQQTDTPHPQLSVSSIGCNIFCLLCCVCIIYFISTGLGNMAAWACVILLLLPMSLSAGLTFAGKAIDYSNYMNSTTTTTTVVVDPNAQTAATE